MVQNAGKAGICTIGDGLRDMEGLATQGCVGIVCGILRGRSEAEPGVAHTEARLLFLPLPAPKKLYSCFVCARLPVF